jgi:hypothetical protein
MDDKKDNKDDYINLMKINDLIENYEGINNYFLYRDDEYTS